MPITPFLGDVKVDPETRRAMGVAFEIVCTALNVRAPDDMLKPVIARKIIALAQSGERDANRLGEFALIDLRKGS